MPLQVTTVSVNVDDNEVCVARDRSVNRHIRQRLRELRKRKMIGAQRLAEAAGIPVSSYSCLESGYYNISVDCLYRILGVLEADITEVWPSEVSTDASPDSQRYLRRIQEFRVADLISLTGSDGAALFSVYQGKCKVLLYQHLSDFLLDRLCLYLEDDREYGQGRWFRRKRGQTAFVFFLKGDACPDYLAKLIDHYLIIWSNLFGGVLK